MNTPPGIGAMVPVSATGIVNLGEASTSQVRQAPMENQARTPEQNAAETLAQDAPQALTNPNPLAHLHQLHLTSLAARLSEWRMSLAAKTAPPPESHHSNPQDTTQSDLRSPTDGLRLLANAAINTAGAELGAAPHPLDGEAHSHYQPGSPQAFSQVPRATLESYLSSNQVLPSHLMAHLGNTTLLAEALLQAPGELNAQDAAGNTPLHAACRAGKPHTAVTLLGLGANPNVANKTGITPAHLAAELPQPELLRLILNLGAHPDATNVIGNTPLHRAAFKGHVDNITELLRRGAQVDRPNLHGVTALHAAAGQGHLEAVKLLVTRGANPRAQMRLPSGHMAKPSEVSDSPDVRDYLIQTEREITAMLNLLDPILRQ